MHYRFSRYTFRNKINKYQGNCAREHNNHSLRFKNVKIQLSCVPPFSFTINVFLFQSLDAFFMSYINSVSCFATFLRYLSIPVIAFSLLLFIVPYIPLTRIPSLPMLHLRSLYSLLVSQYPNYTEVFCDGSLQDTLCGCAVY